MSGSASRIPTQTGFDGFGAEWYYYDPAAQILSKDIPAGSAMSSSQTPALSVRPVYLSAPPQAIGSTSATQFGGRGKPNAYLKVQITQDRSTGAARPSTWAAMYPVIDNPNDDIASKHFTDPLDGDPIDEVPMPGGTGKLRVPLTAIVGGPSKHTLTTIIGQVLGFATGTAAKALFPIPQADVTLATNVEDLINFASSEFAPATAAQYWIDAADIVIALNSAAGAPADAVKLPSGTTFLVAVPLGPNDISVNEFDKLLGMNYAVTLDRDGAIVASASGSPLDPNPFANLIYVTFRVTVADS